MTKRRGTPRRNALANTSRDADDGQRGSVAVVASLAQHADGTVRLVLADARASTPGQYIETSLFTSRDYDVHALQQLALAPREFQMIGESIVARLVAASVQVSSE